MPLSHPLKHVLPLGGILLLGLGRSAMSGAVPAPTPPSPSAPPLTTFAIFGAEGMALDGPAKIDTGLIGSNGYVSLGPSVQCAGITSGSLRFTSVGGVAVSGPITVNGEIALGLASKINGDINGGANIAVSPQSHVNGSITAAQDIKVGAAGDMTGDIHAGRSFFQEAFHTLNGNVLANEGAEIGGTVNGSVTCRTLSVPFGGHVNGQAKPGTGDVVPLKYTPVTLPAADPIPVNEHTITGSSAPDAPVRPGHYGALILADNQKLYLTAGDYYFSRVVLSKTSSVHLVNISDTHGLHVFVATDITVGIFVKTFVNGQPSADADASLAKKVLWEVGGNFEAAPDGSGSGDFFGAVFAPKGSISVGNYEHLTGSLVSGRRVTAGAGFTQTFVPSGRFALPPAATPAPPAAGALTPGTTP